MKIGIKFIFVAILTLFLSDSAPFCLYAQNKEVNYDVAHAEFIQNKNINHSYHIFARKDTSSLNMDIYFPDTLKEQNPVIMFVFGGGFKNGDKRVPIYYDYYTSLTEMGYIVIAIDYRLGLKDKKGIGPLNVKPLKNAIKIAVEDLYSATNYLLSHAKELKIDTNMIITCGSSAGAITVLQADYELCNKRDIASVLPAGFRYAGVISFAGAILSNHGKIKYREASPAPTLMFHGTADNLVFYNKMQIFRLGMFGTKALTKRFEKYEYPYYTIRYRDIGHDIAETPMEINMQEITFFLDEYIHKQRPLRIDTTIKDPDLKPKMGNMKPKDLYK